MFMPRGWYRKVSLPNPNESNRRSFVETSMSPIPWRVIVRSGAAISPRLESAIAFCRLSGVSAPVAATGPVVLVAIALMPNCANCVRSELTRVRIAESAAVPV